MATLHTVHGVRGDALGGVPSGYRDGAITPQQRRVEHRKPMRLENGANLVQIGLYLLYSPLWGCGGSVAVSAGCLFSRCPCGYRERSVITPCGRPLR